MNFKNILIVLFTILTVFFTSCKKTEPINIAEKGSFTLEFENKVGNLPLVLNTQSYNNANGDSFTISSFKYYVSNITLTNTNGLVYTLPENYILADASKPESLTTKLTNIPAGDYTKLAFTIGVDRERNFAGAQTGALDPTLGMFWTWNSGYIFVKLEGTSPQSTRANKSLIFHIGGVIDPNNTIRTFSTDFNNGNMLRIRSNKNPDLHFKVNAASLFTGNQNINFANLNFTMGGANSVIVANNYANGLFKLDHIHN